MKVAQHIKRIAGWHRFLNLCERSESEARLPRGDACEVLLRATQENRIRTHAPAVQKNPLTGSAVDSGL